MFVNISFWLLWLSAWLLLWQCVCVPFCLMCGGRGETYHLFEHNCNTFSNEVAQFLTGSRIPEYITDLPSEVLSTWVWVNSSSLHSSFLFSNLLRLDNWRFWFWCNSENSVPFYIKDGKHRIPHDTQNVAHNRPTIPILSPFSDSAMIIILLDKRYITLCLTMNTKLLW